MGVPVVKPITALPNAVLVTAPIQAPSSTTIQPNPTLPHPNVAVQPTVVNIKNNQKISKLIMITLLSKHTLVILSDHKVPIEPLLTGWIIFKVNINLFTHPMMLIDQLKC